MSPTRRAVSIATLVVALTAPALAAEDAAPPPVPFQMHTSLMNWGIGEERLRIVVERWSTDEEHERLLDVLSDKGAGRFDDFVAKIKPRTGFIDAPNSLSWDMQYSQATPLPEGGWHILFMMYRVNRPSDWDYIDVGEIDVDGNGEGEGTLRVAKKVYHDAERNEIVLELLNRHEPGRLKLVKAAR